MANRFGAIPLHNAIQLTWEKELKANMIPQLLQLPPSLAMVQGLLDFLSTDSLDGLLERREIPLPIQEHHASAFMQCREATAPCNRTPAATICVHRLNKAGTHLCVIGAKLGQGVGQW